MPYVKDHSPYSYYWLKDQPIDVLNKMHRIIKGDGRGKPFRHNSRAAWELTGANPQWKDKLPEAHTQALALLEAFGDSAVIDSGLVPTPPVSTPPVPTQAASSVSSALNGDVDLSPLTARLDTLETCVNELPDRLTAISRQAVERHADKVIREAVAKAQLPREVHIIKPDGSKHNAGVQHKDFPDLLRALSARLNIWLVGPAGTGKSTAAEECAKALEIPFYVTGQSDTKYDLTGFFDAQGRIINTEFRKAWETGGVWLGDEADGWDANAALALNGALAGEWASFPDGKIKRHADFYCICAANTYGHGADFDYVGRFKQDGAFLDRFITLFWSIDEAIEDSMANNPEWVAIVRRYRAEAQNKGIKVLITPRASMYGARLIAAGFSTQEAEYMAIRKAIKPDQWAAIGGR